MSRQIKVRSTRRREVDEDKLSLAFVMLATILVDSASTTVDALDGQQRAAASPPAEETPVDGAEVRSLIEAYYREVEALKAGGATNAEAIRQVADRYQKTPNAVRAGAYQFAKRLARDGAL